VRCITAALINREVAVDRFVANMPGFSIRTQGHLLHVGQGVDGSDAQLPFGPVENVLVKRCPAPFGRRRIDDRPALVDVQTILFPAKDAVRFGKGGRSGGRRG